MCALVALKYCTHFEYVKSAPICCRVQDVEDLQQCKRFLTCDIVGMYSAYCTYFQQVSEHLHTYSKASKSHSKPLFILRYPSIFFAQQLLDAHCGRSVAMYVCTASPQFSLLACQLQDTILLWLPVCLYSGFLSSPFSLHYTSITSPLVN